MTQHSAETLREHQLYLERLYDKHQLIPRVRQAFESTKTVDFEQHMLDHDIMPKFGFDLLAHMALRKRALVSVMVGILRHHLGDSQETADMLEKCVHAGLVTLNPREDGESELVVVFEISERLQAELDRFQFPLPMVVRPRELKNNLDSGYLTQKSSVILRDNHTEEDVCLDHLNRLNQTALTINLDTAQVIQNRWRNLDKPKPGESWEDFRKRERAFEKYDRTSKDVMELLLMYSNRFYLTHKYDKRGRSYCMGYHVSYQGNDWNKAVIELADKETLNES